MYPQNSLNFTDQSNQKNKSIFTVGSRVKNKTISGLFLILITALFTLQSCQDSGFVGASFLDQGADIKVDTIAVDSFEFENLKGFTGNLANFTAGAYNDQLFGEIRAEAFVAPGLVTDVEFFDDSFDFYLRFIVSGVSGDTLGTAEFEVEYIDERWRSSQMDVNSQLASTPPSVPVTFSVAHTDSLVEVQLPQEWVQKYVDIDISADRETRLLNEEFGFKIKPVSGDMLVTFRGGSNQSRIVIKDPGFELLENGDDNGNGNGNGNGEEEEDDVYVNIPFRAWAYNVQNNAPSDINDNLIPVFNTFNKALKLDINFEDYKDLIITRAELVLYRDTLLLQNTLPDGHIRPDVTRLAFYQLDEFDTEFLLINVPNFTPEIRSTADFSYRISLTETIRRLSLGGTFRGSFYVLSQSNNGFIFPEALNHPSHPERAPKLIITHAKPEVN